MDAGASLRGHGRVRVRLPGRPGVGSLALLAAAAAVTLIALGLRLVAVDRLPIDYDEDDYLRAGQLYAAGLRSGDPSVLLRENYRPEHPPLTKIVTGVVLAALPPAPLVPDLATSADPASTLPEPQFTAARLVQVTAGVVTVGALALLDPLGGLLLAIDTWTIKYTSQVMLEALPAMLSAIAVLAYLRRRRRWLVVSAIAFGLACAAKYPYGIVGLAILLDRAMGTPEETDAESGAALARLRGAVGRLRPFAGWVAVALAAFALGDPYLWPDPVGRLASSLGFHLGYASSAAVTGTGWPSWQPLVWLLGSVPFHEPGTFVVALDSTIAVLAALGFARTYRRRRVVALWLAIGLALLFFWPTKWPQYLLIVTPPLALSAAEGGRRAILEPLRRRVRPWRARVLARVGGDDAELNPMPTRTRERLRGSARDLGRALPWLAPGLVAATLLGLVPVLYEIAMAMTDFTRDSIRDGVTGGVLREVVGGVTGGITAIAYGSSAATDQVHFVGGQLLGLFANGLWLGGNTSAQFPAFSLLWTVLVVGLQTVLGIAVAVVLAPAAIRLRTAWRVLFILPWAIPEFVGAVAWGSILQRDHGWLALLLGTPLGWADNPDASLLVLLMVGVWIGWPLMMLVASAGLATIPAPLLEAAALDGAGRWARFRTIVLPLLMPLLAPVLVIRGIAAFNQFYLFYVLAPPESATTTATWSYYIFDSSNGPGLYAASAAVNVVTLVLIAIVVAWFLHWRAHAERVPFALETA